MVVAGLPMGSWMLGTASVRALEGRIGDGVAR